MNHSTMNYYIKALRAPFLAGSLTPVIIGAAFAFVHRQFSFSLFFITSMGVAALHLASNLLNDYYDAKGSDPVNVRVTPFSGGSRVIQNKQIRPRYVLLLSVFFYALSVAAGIWLVFLERPLVIAIGLFGFALGWAYSAPPLQLMSRGWGEISIFFAFGPFITLGAYYAISGSLSWPAFALGLPHGFFITAVIWINQFPDYQADRQANKKNLVVRLGPKISRYPYCLIMLLAFITVIFLVSIAALSYMIMLSFIAIPLAFKAMRILWRQYLSHERLVPAQALTIHTLIAHGMLLSLGLVLSRFV
jgi:1,4-dihydroxy-2-naphthoate octaprenyltransferase